MMRSSQEHRRGNAVRQIVGALLFVLVAAGAAGAEDLSGIPAAFVDVGIGAAQMGMGGAVAASVEGPGSIYWNPAGLAGASEPMGAVVDYADVMGLVPYTAATGLYRLGDRNTIGAGVLYSGDDVLSEMTLLVAGARTFSPPPWDRDRRIRAGATVKTRWASFGNNESTEGQVTGSALGFGLDAGVTVPVPGDATVGLVWRDIVSSLNWDSSAAGSYGESVPGDILLGLAVRPRENVILEVDLDAGLHETSRDLIAAGTEIRLFRVAAIRGGYRWELSPGELEEFSIGAGANVTAGRTDIALDLAYLWGFLDNTLRLSLGFRM